jgi:hypothetical protein
MAFEANQTRSLTQRFFEEVRRVNLGEKQNIDFSVEDFAIIAGDVGLLMEFYRSFDSFSRDPDAKLLIIELIRKLATAQEGATVRYDETIALIDRYPARVTGGAVIGGSGALLYGAVATGAVPIVGPAILAVCGIIGFSVCVYGRLRLARNKENALTMRRNFEQLVTQLEVRMSQGTGEEP